MYKLCVYAICKNEISRIQKWLDSVREADYIVVLDTGSTDGTYEFLQKQEGIILEQQIIEPFRFDVARNKALELIPDDCDICLPLDIDQEMVKDFSIKLKQAWLPNVSIMYFPQYYRTTHKAGRWAAHLRNKATWKYPVYEQLITDGKTAETLATMVVHDWDMMRESHELYPELAELGMKENPTDPYCFRAQHQINEERKRREERKRNSN